MSSTLATFAPDRLVSHRAAHARMASRTATAPATHDATASTQRGGVAVRIERLLDTARRPGEARVRDRGTLDRDALLRLREAIDAVLGQDAAT